MTVPTSYEWTEAQNKFMTYFMPSAVETALQARISYSLTSELLDFQPPWIGHPKRIYLEKVLTTDTEILPYQKEDYLP